MGGQGRAAAWVGKGGRQPGGRKRGAAAGKAGSTHRTAARWLPAGTPPSLCCSRWGRTGRTTGMKHRPKRPQGSQPAGGSTAATTLILPQCCTPTRPSPHLMIGLNRPRYCSVSMPCTSGTFRLYPLPCTAGAAGVGASVGSSWPTLHAKPTHATRALVVREWQQLPPAQYRHPPGTLQSPPALPYRGRRAARPTPVSGGSSRTSLCTWEGQEQIGRVGRHHVSRRGSRRSP